MTVGRPTLYKRKGGWQPPRREIPERLTEGLEWAECFPGVGNAPLPCHYTIMKTHACQLERVNG